MPNRRSNVCNCEISRSLLEMQESSIILAPLKLILPSPSKYPRRNSAATGFAVGIGLAIELVQTTVRKHSLPALLKFVNPALICIAKLYFFFMDGCFGEQTAQNVRQIFV